MELQELLEIIDMKEISREEISDWVIKDNSLLEFIMKGLGHKKANIKYGCEKVLRILSENAPKLLYPHFDFFVSNLSGDNKFIKLGSIIILANLTVVDKEGKFDKIHDDYLSIITAGDLTPAANTIKSTPIIIKHKPYLVPRITDELIKVEIAEFDTEECRNIALGHAINSFYKFFPLVQEKEPVINFVNNQLDNNRNSTQKKALKFVKRYKLN